MLKLPSFRHFNPSLSFILLDVYYPLYFFILLFFYNLKANIQHDDFTISMIPNQIFHLLKVPSCRDINQLLLRLFIFSSKKFQSRMCLHFIVTTNSSIFELQLGSLLWIMNFFLELYSKYIVIRFIIDPLNIINARHALSFFISSCCILTKATFASFPFVITFFLSNNHFFRLRFNVEVLSATP